MSIRRFSTSSLTTGSKSSKLWDQETLPGAFESIAVSVVDASGSSSVTFSNIPQVYAHLQVRVFAQTNRATYGSDNAYLRVGNGTVDSGSNYAWHNLYGGSASASVFTNGGASQVSDYILNSGSLGTTAGGSFGCLVIDIMDYTSTSKYKTVRAIGGVDDNANTGGFGLGVGLNSAMWMNSGSPINTLSLTPQQGSAFNRYSSFALYGIRGA